MMPQYDPPRRFLDTADAWRTRERYGTFGASLALVGGALALLHIWLRGPQLGHVPLGIAIVWGFSRAIRLSRNAKARLQELGEPLEQVADE